MPDPEYRSLEDPDETIEFPGASARLVELGDLTIGELTTQPGWRWSTNNRPIVGGDWCQARHVGVIVSGRLRVHMLDGTEFELRPNDAFDIPAGHDAWTVGEEPCVQFELAGIRAWAGFPTGIRSRVLATLPKRRLHECPRDRRLGPPRRSAAAPGDPVPHRAHPRARDLASWVEGPQRELP